MHDHCAVSHCGKPTQDTICGSCVDTLVKAILSIVRYAHPDAPANRLVLVANTGDEAPDEKAPTADPQKTVELDSQHTGLWEDLNDTITRQHRMARGERTGTSDGSPLLFVEAASDARRTLESTVWYWVYLFADANQHLTFDPYTATVPDACAWIAGFPGLIASLPGAVDMLGDFLRDTTEAARVIDRAPDRSLLGFCNTATEMGGCTAALWVYPGQDVLYCRNCGTEHDVDPLHRRRVEMVMQQTGTPTEVARLLEHFVGLQVKVNSIRTWARLGQLHAAGENAAGFAVFRVFDVVRVSEAKKTRERGPNAVVDVA